MTMTRVIRDALSHRTKGTVQGQPWYAVAAHLAWEDVGERGVTDDVVLV